MTLAASQMDGKVVHGNGGWRNAMLTVVLTMSSRAVKTRAICGTEETDISFAVGTLG
jgi:hypothetical protein